MFAPLRGTDVRRGDDAEYQGSWVLAPPDTGLYLCMLVAGDASCRWYSTREWLVIVRSGLGRGRKARRFEVTAHA